MPEKKWKPITLKKLWVSFIIILLVGAAFRLVNYTNVQPQNPDEAMYLRQARFMATLARMAVGASVSVVDPEAKGVLRYVRKSDWYSKPCWLHSAFMAAPMMIFGRTTGVGLSVNILFSLGTMVLVVLTGRRMFGDTVGLAGAFVLAVSHYWLVYSRGFNAEVDAVFLVVLSFYLIVIGADTPHKVGWWKFTLAGVSAALACLCHYRLFFIIGPLGCGVLLLSRKWRTALLRGVLFGLAFFAVILATDVLLRIAARNVGPTLPFNGLLAALAERYFPSASDMPTQTGWQPWNFVDYLRHILRWQGVAAFVLMVTGLVGLLFSRLWRQGVAILAMIVLPLVVLTLQVWVVSRAASVVLPFTCLAAGYGVCFLFDYASKLTNTLARYLALAFVAGLCIAVVVENGVQNVFFLNNKTGYIAASVLLADQHICNVYGTAETRDLLGWYAPAVTVLPLRSFQDGFGEHPQEDVVLFDGMTAHYYPQSRQPLKILEEQISKMAAKRVIIPNMTTTWKHFLYDGSQAHSLKDMEADMKSIDPLSVNTIRMYWLD